MLGKVLRIDVDDSDIIGNHKLLYSVPKDNPFLDEIDTKNEIYALGARNMWRCSVDIGMTYFILIKASISFHNDFLLNRSEQIEQILSFRFSMNNLG